MSKVFSEVSQYSREAGRVPVHVLHERLQDERKKLIGKKQRIEAELSEIASRKADRLSQVYRRRMHKSDTIAATNEIQSDFNEERSKLIREKAGIDQRLHDIKRRLSASADVREDVKVLLRIEALLERILDKVSST